MLTFRLLFFWWRIILICILSSCECQRSYTAQNVISYSHLSNESTNCSYFKVYLRSCAVHIRDIGKCTIGSKHSCWQSARIPSVTSRLTRRERDTDHHLEELVETILYRCGSSIDNELEMTDVLTNIWVARSAETPPVLSDLVPFILLRSRLSGRTRIWSGHIFAIQSFA